MSCVVVVNNSLPVLVGCASLFSIKVEFLRVSGAMLLIITTGILILIPLFLKMIDF